MAHLAPAHALITPRALHQASLGPCPHVIHHGRYQLGRCCGSKGRAEVAGAALSALNELLTDSRANVRALLAAEDQCRSLFQDYLCCCGIAGHQVQKDSASACSQARRMVGWLDVTMQPGSALAHLWHGAVGFGNYVSLASH